MVYIRKLLLTVLCVLLAKSHTHMLYTYKFMSLQVQVHDVLVDLCFVQLIFKQLTCRGYPSVSVPACNLPAHRNLLHRSTVGAGILLQVHISVTDHDKRTHGTIGNR